MTDHASKHYEGALEHARELLARVGELWPLAHLVRSMLYAVLGRLAGMMVDDPRAISAGLDILFVAKSLERIADHAKNIGEHTVYAAMGRDVRHASVQELERLVQR